MRRVVLIAVTAVVCSLAGQGQTLVDAEECNKRGLTFFRNSQLSEAEQAYRQGMAIARKFGLLGLVDYTAIETNLAVALQSQGRVAEARQALEETIAISTNELGNRGSTLAHALNNLALMEMTEARYGKGVSLLKRALSLKYVDERTRAGTIHNLGAAYFDMGQQKKAEQMFEEAIAEYERLGRVGELSPALTYMAKIAARRADLVRAEALLNKALEHRKQTYGPTHPNVALTLSDLGDFESERGRLDQAVDYFQRALEIVEPVLGKDHLFSAPIWFHFAEARQRQGRYAEALDLYKRTIVVLERAYGPEHARLAQVLKNASVCSSKLKQKDQAKEYASRSQSIQSRNVSYGQHSVDVNSLLPVR